MPKPAWYVAENRHDPTPLPDLFVSVLLPDLAGQFGEHTHPGPAHTAAALTIALEMAGHIGRAVAARHLPTDEHELDRLVVGLNHLAAQLAQTLQRLAYHADRQELPGLHDTSVDQAAAVTTSLAHAGLYSELAAGHLKEARLILVKHHLATHPTA